jgi:6-phosphogluconate dehydrogenase
MSNDEMHACFTEWNKGELDSYLIEITRDILAYKDETARPWSTRSSTPPGRRAPASGPASAALDLGVPLTLIGEAVFARCLSALKDDRVAASKILRGRAFQFTGDKKAFVEDIRQALLASKIVSYAQGFMLLREAAKEYGWDLNYGGLRHGVARRLHHPLRFPRQDQGRVRHESALPNLLLDPYFQGVIERCQAGWRRAVSKAVEAGVPVPAFSTALSFFDGYPQRAAAREPAAGPARLLRRAHLRARRPAARQVLPHQLDRQRADQRQAV